MFVDIALHVVHSLIEVKTYMFFVSCSAFIVDISEIEEVGVFLQGKFESILCIRIFLKCKNLLLQGSKICLDYDSEKFNEPVDSYKIPIITVC